MAKVLLELAEEFCQGKILFALEGGTIGKMCVMVFGLS